MLSEQLERGLRSRPFAISMTCEELSGRSLVHQWSGDTVRQRKAGIRTPWIAPLTKQGGIMTEALSPSGWGCEMMTFNFPTGRRTTRKKRSPQEARRGYLLSGQAGDLG